MEQLAIIVLNYNDFLETQNCINKMLELKVKERIIIVDNKSNNDSFTILKNRYGNIVNIDVVQSKENRGYSYGNNFGMKYAIQKYPSIKYFCIMNPDVMIIKEDVFSHLIQKLEKNNNIAAISPIMLLNGKYNFDGMCWDIPTEKTIYYNHILFRKNKKRKESLIVSDDLVAEVGVIPGSFFIIKRNEMEKIDFLDENVFLYNEENILSNKLLKINKRVALSIDDYYVHNHKKSNYRTLREMLKLNEIGYQSRKYLCQKFYSKRSLKKLKVINIINIIYLYMINGIRNIKK